MKKLILSLFLVLATSLSVFAMSYEEAKSQNKPVVILFSMNGCGACKQFAPTFEKFASKFSNKFNFVKENVTTSNIAKKLAFDTVPALFIIDPKTNKSKRISDNCAWDDGCFTKTLEEYN